MKRVIFTISGLFFLFLNTIYSQEIQPNDEMVIYSEESDMPRRIGYNPLNYFEQERYRPDHSLFSNNHFTDNMSIGLYGGIDGIFQREGSFFLAGPRLGIYVSKFFSPVSGLELSASMARNKKKFSDYNLRSYNISADYDFTAPSDDIGEIYENQSGVFYEIFVHSFCDSNGDGIGDKKLWLIPYIRKYLLRIN